MMNQGLFSFKYESTEKSGLTALAGLPTFFELAWALGMAGSIPKHVNVRSRSQGWTDAEHIIGLVLLNNAGGNCVEDLDRMEADEGLCQLMFRVRTFRMGRRKRRELARRWRKGRQRAFTSRSATRRYLKEFHNDSEEERRLEKWEKEYRAFIPESNRHLSGLSRVCQDLVATAQHHHPIDVATLDQDATLVGSSKQAALYCYKGHKAYQPFNTWWAEQQLIVHTEFLDGNVLAGHQQLRCFEEALQALPKGVKKVLLRSDTAGYQHELLRYCARRLKAIRFHIIGLPGQVVRHARSLVIKLGGGNEAYQLLVTMRTAIANLIPAPAT